MQLDKQSEDVGTAPIETIKKVTPNVGVAKQGHKPSIDITRSEKKTKALQLWKTGKFTKSDVARKVKQNTSTVWNWIEDSIREIKELEPAQRIHIWQKESLKDIQLASIARDSLMSQLEDKPETISTNEKRAILYASSLSGGLKWDKSRIEAGKSTQNIEIHNDIRLLKELEKDTNDNKRDNAA